MAVRGQGKFSSFDVTVQSPERTGALQIVDARDDRLILRSDQGQTLYFDVAAQSFISTLDQPAPTTTPVPTKTPYAFDQEEGADDARNMPVVVFDFSPADTDLSYFIDSPTDIDWFRFQAYKKGTIKISLRQPPGSFGLSVYRLNDHQPGTAIAVGEDTAPGRGNKGITLRDAEVGNYMVRVSSLDGSYSSDQPYLLRFEPPALEKIIPLLKCVSDNGDGTFNAYWGYQNPNPMVVALEPGSQDNRFQPKPEVRTGQPDLFIPGLVEDWFGIQFDGNELGWELDGNIAKADRNSPRCH
jgi:hypothetical protein